MWHSCIWKQFQYAMFTSMFDQTESWHESRCSLPYWWLQLEHALSGLYCLPIILSKNTDLKEGCDIPVVFERGQTALLANQVVQRQPYKTTRPWWMQTYLLGFLTTNSSEIYQLSYESHLAWCSLTAHYTDQIWVFMISNMHENIKKTFFLTLDRKTNIFR